MQGPQCSEPLELSGDEGEAADSGCPEVSSKARPGGKAPGGYRDHVENGSELNKSKRRDFDCKYCDHRFISTRPEDVYKHLTDMCPGVTSAIRQKVSEQFADKLPALVPAAKRLRSRLGKQPATSRPAASGGSGTSGSMHRFTGASERCPPLVQTSLDTKAARAFIHAGIPFHAANDPFFVEWIQELRPSYQPPGGT